MGQQRRLSCARLELSPRFQAQYVGDLCTAMAGHPCQSCGSALESTKAVEVGNIFQLGTFYSEAMGCYFTDECGKEQPVIMGSYGIGLGRWQPALPNSTMIQTA